MLTRSDLPVGDEFWAVFANRSSAECWPWPGTEQTGWYGEITRTVDGKKRRWSTHRIAFVLAHGEIPDGFLVCHTCDNPPCCNPTHLFLGNSSDNTQDMLVKGRGVYRRGENNGAARLSDVSASCLRAVALIDVFPLRQLARWWGVTHPAVLRIVRSPDRLASPTSGVSAPPRVPVSTP